VPLRTTFTQTFSAFASTSHDAARLKTKRWMIQNFLVPVVLLKIFNSIDQWHEVMGVARLPAKFLETHQWRDVRV
jgi:hypothetical protein